MRISQTLFSPNLLKDNNKNNNTTCNTRLQRNVAHIKREGGGRGRRRRHLARLSRQAGLFCQLTIALPAANLEISRFPQVQSHLANLASLQNPRPCGVGRKLLSQLMQIACALDLARGVCVWGEAKGPPAQTGGGFAIGIEIAIAGVNGPEGVCRCLTCLAT